MRESLHVQIFFASAVPAAQLSSVLQFNSKMLISACVSLQNKVLSEQQKYMTNSLNYTSTRDAKLLQRQEEEKKRRKKLSGNMDFAEFSTWSDGKETTEGASSTSAENIEAEHFWSRHRV